MRKDEIKLRKRVILIMEFEVRTKTNGCKRSVFSGTRLPLRKSITMRWKSVGTTADVGGRRWNNGGRRWTSAGRRNSEVKEESGNSLHSLNRCGLVEC